MKQLVYMFIIALLVGCTGKSGKQDATGTFQATEVILSGEVAGTLLTFQATEGDALEKGQQIGQIDSIQFFLQKQQLEQHILALEASRPIVSIQLAPIEEQLAKQQREKQRVENLLKSDAATTKELDDINSAIQVLEKQLEAQKNTLNKSVATIEAQIGGLKAQIEQLEDRLRKCVIVSPISGTVLAKYAQEGELCSAGRPLLKIADMNEVHLKAYVTSDQLIDIRLGQEVDVKADFGGGNARDYKGKITWISEKSEFTPKNITTSDERANMVYAMKIAVQNDGYLKLGMYGEVNF